MKNLLLIVVFLLLAESIFSSAIARCSIDTLRNVCNICEERALSKTELKTDSACPACPEVNCPQVSQACIQVDSFTNFLASSYTVNAMIWDGEPDVTYKLNVSKNSEVIGSFKYDLRYNNFRTAVADSTGFIFYDIVNFNLPLDILGQTYSYNCIGTIDNTSQIKGLCSTIADDGEGKTTSYSFLFTAIPNSNPIQ